MNIKDTPCANHYHIPNAAILRQQCLNRDHSSWGREREDSVHSSILDLVKTKKSSIQPSSKQRPIANANQSVRQNGLETVSVGQDTSDVQASLEEAAWDIESISCPRITSSFSNSTKPEESNEVAEKLLHTHPKHIPFHDPHLYMANAVRTRSAVGFETMAFPDFWGHCPPSTAQPMLDRKRGVQR